MKSSSIYLALGSNLGDREAGLREAALRIEALGLEVVKASSIYETEPVGYLDQPLFLNQVVEVEERGSGLIGETASADRAERAEALLTALLKIEDLMGRVRAARDGPRVIDIDLLLYGDLVIDKTSIIVPHPRMHLRRFVLEPLCEIAPDATHPLTKRTCREMLADLDRIVNGG